jgi:glutathionyl-hydroquinone reductase
MLELGTTKRSEPLLCVMSAVPRDLYQIPAMKRTVNCDHLKIGIVNHRPDAPVAEGPFIDYEAPHQRAQLE